MKEDHLPELIHVRFRDRALRTPDKPALISDGRVVSYGDLLQSVQRVAFGLRTMDPAVGRVVALHMDRSIESVSVMLGALAAGAAVVPLPRDFPEARVRRILDAASVSLVVSDAGFDTIAGRRAWSIDALSRDPEEPEGVSPSFGGNPTDPAFVLSSSGSTGRPKLIVRSHRSFFHRFDWTWERHPYEEHEVCCQKSPLTTTHAVYELFEPLIAGVPVVIVPDDVVRDLEAFWRLLSERSVSRLLIVPSHLRASLDVPGFEPPHFRMLVLMGEHVDRRLAERTVRVFPSTTRAYSIYGSTEASSTLVCDLREPWGEGDPPLGDPISEAVVPSVLKADGTAARAGERGRLFISGPALFDGYLGDDERTAKVLDATPGVGPVYDTHDDVLVTEGGALRYLGRMDDTVKVRGHRVDLLEVEGALRSHPSVTSAAVILDGGAEAISLTGFVCPAEVDPRSIRAYLADIVPSYMVPPRVLALEDMPLTSGGKVDREALKALLADAAGKMTPTEELEGPRSPTEVLLFREWVSVLGHDDFGRTHTFFEVGGTSLTVFALVHRLRTALDVSNERLSAETVYRLPTVAALAGYLDGESESPGDSRSQPILVRLRRGSERGTEPFFVVASAGGTVGAYERMVAALQTSRSVYGIRDPFLWAGRDPGDGFHAWVDAYLDAVRALQPTGPYYLCAYSSAGAFGYEIARRIRASGERVGLLVLIDPLALDRGDRSRFGYWVLRSTYGRGLVRLATRCVGLLRRRWLPPAYGEPDGSALDRAFSDEEVREIEESSLMNRTGLMLFSALMELNSGLPLALEEKDIDTDGSSFDAFMSRLQRHIPDVDRETIRRMMIQYEMQVRTQHAHRLSTLDAPVLLLEPRSRYSGLISAQLRPYLSELTSRVIALSEPSGRVRQLSDRFGALAPHYRSMRDARFVEGVAREISNHLGDR